MAPVQNMLLLTWFVLILTSDGPRIHQKMLALALATQLLTAVPFSFQSVHKVWTLCRRFKTLGWGRECCTHWCGASTTAASSCTCKCKASGGCDEAGGAGSASSTDCVLLYPKSGGGSRPWHSQLLGPRDGCTSQVHAAAVPLTRAACTSQGSAATVPLARAACTSQDHAAPVPLAKAACSGTPA